MSLAISKIWAKTCKFLSKFRPPNLDKNARVINLNPSKPLRFFSLKNIPITMRITLWYSFFIFMLISVLVGVCAFVLDEMTDDVGEKKLAQKTLQMAQSASFKAYDDGIFFIWYDNDGVVTDGIAPKDFRTNLTLKEGLVREFESDDDEFYYFDVKVKNAWLRGVVVVSEFESAMSKIFIFALALAPFVMIFVVFGGYKIIKNAFFPLRMISQTAQNIASSGDFSRRINLPYGKDELHSLAGTLNSMLTSLEQAHAHEKQLTSDISHELRTPTSIILATSDYALNYELDAAESKESFATIARQARKIAQLIEQILELARMQSAENLVLNRLNLSQILDRALDDYELLLAQRGLNLRRQIAPNVQIYGDELLLSRLIDNLLSNAIKFTRTFVEISLSQSGELAVKDDGIGIAQDECAPVWEKFYQADRSRNKTQNGGAGLGLAVVAQVAKLHGAQVFLDSELGRGSVFGVRFKAV